MFRHLIYNYLYIKKIGILNLQGCKLLIDPLKIKYIQITLEMSPKYVQLVLKNLNKFINLEQLLLFNINIKDINGLDELINLKKLDLSCNKITEIKGLDNLVNLQELYLYNN